MRKDRIARYLREFTPARLFEDNEQGAWYDPSDITTLFQDAAGTTPVTATGQPAGRVLDKSGRSNHATQPTAAQRPIYRRGDSRGVVNLLRWSEDFSNVFWNKVRSSIAVADAVAPDGSFTAQKLIEDTTASATHYVQRPIAYIVAETYTITCFMKQAGRIFSYLSPNSVSATSGRVTFNLSNGTFVAEQGASGSIVTAGNGWYQCTATFTAVADSSRVDIGPSALSSGQPVYSGDGVSGVYIWGAQLQQGTATPYQRNESTLGGVATGQDTDLRWLEFDGVDDFLETALPFSQAPHMVMMGVRSNATITDLVGTGNTASGNGLLMLYEGRVRSHVWGSELSTVDSSNSLTPSASVVAAQIRTADSIVSRLNGVSTSAPLLGTSATSADSLSIGTRSGSEAPGAYLNGRMYSLVIRAALTSEAAILATEIYIAAKSGVTL